MANKYATFTGQQRAFIDAMARTGDKVYSAGVAGYASVNRAYDMPDHVLAEIDRRGRKLIIGDLLPKALFRVDQALQDPTTPLKEITPLLKVLLAERTRDGAAGKEPSEMTAAELADAITEAKVRQQALTRLAADRASPVLELEAVSEDPDDDIFG